MDESKIQMVLEYSVCTRERAIATLLETNGNITEALVRIIEVPASVCAPKQKVMTDEQLFFTNVRRQLDNLDASIRSGFTSQDQHVSLESSDLQVLHEEKVPQNNCSREYHPLSPESEVQIPEIVYQLPSEYSYDSQSNAQK